MKLYTDTIKYHETIEMAKKIEGDYDEPMIYHCFWNGVLNPKHYISILSCFYFNVHKRKNRKIILWTDCNHENNELIRSISSICEIRFFDFKKEIEESGLPQNLLYGSHVYSFISDRIRYILLYKYGGVWFDLDILFLRSFDPLLKNFQDDLLVYTFGHCDYPNGAIFMSPKTKSDKMLHFINFMVDRNQGYGFQESNLTFDTPVDLLVLPSSWFDSWWLPDFDEYPKTDHRNIDFFQPTVREVTFENFCSGAFCFHWHNLWEYPISENSYLHKLYENLLNKLNTEKQYQ